MTRPSPGLPALARIAALGVCAAVALAFAGQAAAAPPKPPGLRVASTTKTSIAMTWRKPAGAVRYRIVRNGKFVKSVTGLRATVGGIHCNRVYRIAVRAIDRQGQASPAATRSVRKGTGCTPRSRIVLTNRRFSCDRPLAQIARAHGIGGKPGRLPLLVRVRFTTYVGLDPGVIELRRGCVGDGLDRTIDLILKVDGDGRTKGGTSDAIKVRETARDIQITGYANCGPRARGAHQDGAQIQGGNTIEFIDFAWGNWAQRRATCHGAAGTFVPASVNNYPVVNMACIRCSSISCNHGMYVGTSTNAYVEDSRWRSGNPADRTVPLANGNVGLCDHGSPPCLNQSTAAGLRVVGNYCDRWPYAN